MKKRVVGNPSGRAKRRRAILATVLEPVGLASRGRREYRRAVRSRYVAVTFALAVALVASRAPCTPHAHASDWPLHGRDAGETRYSPLADIDDGNASRLGLRWAVDLGSKRGLVATPIMVDGVLYTTSTWSVVYAIDALTGKTRWRFDPGVSHVKIAGRACCDVVNRGVAVHDRRVYVATLDGRLIAIDARMGEPIWEVQTTDPTLAYTITGAPRVVKDKVLIGNSGGEFGLRGYVSAYDTKTGALAWRFHTVPGDPGKAFENPELEAAAKTWTGSWWRFGGGANVSAEMLYDAELDLVYVGTGSPSPWDTAVRSPGGGDNLFASTILALRPDTGEPAWHYQTTPADRFGFSAATQMVLADVEIDGAPRKVLMQASTNGFFYVLDRRNGELISADPYLRATWTTGIGADGRPAAATGLDPESRLVQIRPSSISADERQPMSFHPGTGLAYIPVLDGGRSFRSDPAFKPGPGKPNLGYDMRTLSQTASLSGGLLAWDPVARREVWLVRHRTAWNGGTLATAGNLVFQGTGARTFAAFRATDGAKLWEVDVPSGIVAAPITYKFAGTQYVAVLSGWGGGFALGAGEAAAVGGNRPGTPGRLLVFAVDSEGTMPTDDISEKEVTAIDMTVDTAIADKGSAVFHDYCARCHGANAVGGGVLPDLRESSQSMYGLLSQVLLNGILDRRGMPSFAGRLDTDDVSAIRAYLLRERAAMLAGKTVGNSSVAE